MPRNSRQALSGWTPSSLALTSPSGIVVSTGAPWPAASCAANSSSSRRAASTAAISSASSSSSMATIHLGHFRLALAPFPFFDRLFLDRVEFIEADEGLDVVARGDAVLRAEAGKVSGRPQLLQSTLIEVKADQ